MGTTPLVVLTFAQLIYTVFGTADQILMMTGHQKDWLLISVGTFACSLVLNMLYVPRFGIVGAAYVSLFSSLMVMVLSVVKMAKITGVWPQDRRHLKPLISAFATGVLLYFVLPLFSVPSAARLLIVLLLSYLIFSALTLIWGLDKEDKELLKVFFFLGSR
jgi:O-antigen/teichoic acid export membrane protein